MKIRDKDLDPKTAETGDLMATMVSIIFDAKEQARHYAIAKQKVAKDPKLRMDLNAQSVVKELRRVLDMQKRDIQELMTALNERIPVPPAVH